MLKKVSYIVIMFKTTLRFFLALIPKAARSSLEYFVPEQNMWVQATCWMIVWTTYPGYPLILCTLINYLFIFSSFNSPMLF